MPWPLCPESNHADQNAAIDWFVEATPYHHRLWLESAWRRLARTRGEMDIKWCVTRVAGIETNVRNRCNRWQAKAKGMGAYIPLGGWPRSGPGQRKLLLIGWLQAWTTWPKGAGSLAR